MAWRRQPCDWWRVVWVDGDDGSRVASLATADPSRREEGGLVFSHNDAFSLSPVDESASICSPSLSLDAVCPYWSGGFVQELDPKELVVEVVIKAQELEAEAVVVLVITPVEGRSAGRIREDGIHSLFCGRSAHLIPALTRVKGQQAARQMCMKITIRLGTLGTLDDLLINGNFV